MYQPEQDLETPQIYSKTSISKGQEGSPSQCSRTVIHSIRWAIRAVWSKEILLTVPVF